MKPVKKGTLKRGTMNILVIGNGFDLAHGLPTKYTDFLDFVQAFQKSNNVPKEKLSEEKEKSMANILLL